MINFVEPNSQSDVVIYYESLMYQEGIKRLNLMAMDSCIAKLALIFEDEEIQNMMIECLTNLNYTGDYSEIPYSTQQQAQAGVVAQLILKGNVTVEATITL